MRGTVEWSVLCKRTLLRIIEAWSSSLSGSSQWALLEGLFWEEHDRT